MKLSKRMVLFVDVFVILVGVVFVFIGLVLQIPILKELLEAIGIGLVAAGVVNILDHILAQEPKIEGIRMAAPTRATLDNNIYNRKNSAKKVDILGISLTSCLKKLVNDSNYTMINRVLYSNTRLRLLFVHPQSQFIKQRALEDGLSDAALIEKQKHCIELCVLFYKHLKECYDAGINSHALDQEPHGSVEIKLIDFCPHITIDRADDEIYWGLYTSATVGINSPMFVVTKEENYVVYNQLKGHFECLLNKGISPDHVLLSMLVGAPTLNTKLAEDILGSAKLQTLLQ